MRESLIPVFFVKNVEILPRKVLLWLALCKKKLYNLSRFHPYFFRRGVDASAAFAYPQTDRISLIFSAAIHWLLSAALP